MKYFAGLCLLLILCINLFSCAESQDSLAQTENVLKPTPTNSQKDMSINQEDNILSKNYSVAEKALNRAILQKDKKTLRLGLKSPIFTIKQKTVETIADISDETFIPSLIEVLEKNQGTVAGGNEVKVMQQDLNKAIVLALEQLTGLQFLFSEKLSANDIQRILNESREWWKVHQREKQQ
ncbi:MAG TPA: hypothetical protein VK892_23255 [Pyrinomonadaceae bacterium]|nr:hypothetical protein [Pyrinomonadaceae bacterium]